MSLRNTLGGVRRGIHVAVVAALVTIVGGLTYRELRGIDRPYSQAEPRAVVPSVSRMFDYKPTLLVVGDSYADTYPDLVADKMGWSLALDAQDGSGFVHCVDNRSIWRGLYIDPLPPPVPFIDRLDRDVATYRADYVLIDGGRSDLGEPPEPVVAAADEYIKDVHSHWPNAKIIIMLPATATPDVAANYSVVAQGLRRTAESVGAYVVDPMAQGWYRDINVKALQKDSIHLNDNGEIYYAGKIIENLKQMGSAS
jgi:GDSL-like Lipase/Acylhydrolase family